MLRFALSPTGDLHIADLRVALLNYIAAKQKNEDLIIRVEDIDKDKNIEGKDKEILDLLALFSIEYSQVIYQSENVRFHTAMALQLMHEKKAFSCFCSQQWLETKKDEAKKDKIAYKYDDACRNLSPELVIDNTNPFRIRINKPDTTIIIDDIAKGDVKFEADTLDSFMIMKEDKTPSYDFASAVDDMLSDISFVVCNESYIDNILKQNHIRDSLKYSKKLQYLNLAPILNKNTNSTDETDNIFNIKWLLEDGYLPEAISNYLISMGSNLSEKIFTLKESIEIFSLDSVSNSPILFDIDKLKDINHKHLKMLDSKELSRYVGFADEEIGDLAKLYLGEVNTTKELRFKINLILANREIPNHFKEETALIIKKIKDAPYFEEYDDFKNFIIKESKVEEEKFIISLRYILTGTDTGPDIAKIYKYLKNYIGEIVK
jgi:glutamyl-tRNA synthetase